MDIPIEERRRIVGLEWRAEDSGPGVLSGVVMRFGDTGHTPWGERERFEPGSLQFDAGGVILNRQHDRRAPLARYPDGGLELSVSPEAVRMRARVADTQDGRDTVALVRAGIMRGLSVEFVPEDETRDDAGVRIIRRARMVGAAVVDDGAYPRAEVEAQRMRIQMLDAGWDLETALDGTRHWVWW